MTTARAIVAQAEAAIAKNRELRAEIDRLQRDLVETARAHDREMADVMARCRALENALEDARDGHKCDTAAHGLLVRLVEQWRVERYAALNAHHKALLRSDIESYLRRYGQ